jgi:hypothetical protein
MASISLRPGIFCTICVQQSRRGSMFEASQTPADPVSVVSRIAGAPAPKRERRQLLTKIDGRLPLGKRIKRLVSLFEAAFPAEALTALKREQIATAAQLQAMAEEERGKWMRATPSATWTNSFGLSVERFRRSGRWASARLNLRSSIPSRSTLLGPWRLRAPNEAPQAHHHAGGP